MKNPFSPSLYYSTHPMFCKSRLTGHSWQGVNSNLYTPTFKYSSNLALRRCEVIIKRHQKFITAYKAVGKFSLKQLITVFAVMDQ